MASGIPVVASPVGVNSKIIEDGVNGFLVESRNDWEKALSTVLGSPKFAYEMGRAGRKKIEKEYSLDVWAPKLIDLIDPLLVIIRFKKVYVAAVSLIYALRFIRTYASIYKKILYIGLYFYFYLYFQLLGLKWVVILYIALISLSNATSQFGELTKSHELIWALVLLFIKVYEINYFWINVISSFIFFFGAHYMAQRQTK